MSIAWDDDVPSAGSLREARRVVSGDGAVSRQCLYALAAPRGVALAPLSLMTKGSW